MVEKKFIYAFDRKIRRKVLHVVSRGKATSVISGASFSYSPYKKK